MSEHPFARKRFGQHFLHDPRMIEQIVTALHPKPTENLVEIGPGRGALTTAVLPYVDHLQVVEIDKDLVVYLQNTYGAKLTIHQHDALKFDFSRLGEDKKLRVFGNLPYNISSPLLFHLLSFAPQIQDLLFMLQKEVVMRMAAKPNTADYGRLSIMIQYACQVQWLFDVPPAAFSPPPKVMSSVVKLIPYQEHFPHPLAKDYKLFAQIVNVAFQHRRKTLRKALASIVPSDLYASLGLDPQRRPETLSIEEFVNLSNAVI